MSEEPVFIVGAARSGTTLLRLMLDAHPSFAVPPESHFVVTLASRRLGLRDRPDALLDAILGHHRFALWGVDARQVRDAVIAERPTSYADVIDAVFRAYARLRGARRWGDKTPGYVEHLEFLGREFPRARFVHVIRDGRSVAASVARQPWGPPSAISAAWWWRRRVRRGRRAGIGLGGRYHELRYEDLVQDPPGALAALCDFLGEDYHPAMLRFAETAAARLPPGVTTPGSLHERTVQPVVAGESWFEALSERRRNAVAHACRPLLRELGYPVPDTDIAARSWSYAGWLAAVPTRAVGLLRDVRHQDRRML